jgi:hypothetical protein
MSPPKDKSVADGFAAARRTERVEIAAQAAEDAERDESFAKKFEEKNKKKKRKRPK